ncbi:MAG: calcium-binding protein, partial [Actinomycetota bacterium]
DGRRQINWDAAPAAISDPNPFPGDFFNGDAAPRARGIEFTTPGTGFLLSGDLDDGTPIEFESINRTYLDEFGTFSPERLFTPIGSNVVDVRFFSPVDQTTPATVDGFGAVFTDVDLAGSAQLEYFDVDGNVLHVVTAEGAPGSETLEFLGAQFDDNCVASVRITAGEQPLATEVFDVTTAQELGEPLFGSVADVVAMDDFIFGEPAAPICLGQVPTIVADGSGPVVGTEGDDVIFGTDGRDVIDGRGGNDVICGEGGDDTIRGGAGDDTIDGGANNDTVFGGGGNDTITDPSGTNDLNGQGGNDTIEGGGADDTIDGGAGRDVLRGFAGDDTIVGGQGRDQIRGGAGNDTCGVDFADVTVGCEFVVN